MLRNTPPNPHPLGIILVSSCSHCTLCASKLWIRNDRGSHIMVYTESFGAVVGTYDRKICFAMDVHVVTDSTMGIAHKVASHLSTTM